MLEVEAKFNFNPEQKVHLIAGATFIKHVTNHDIYYDLVDYSLTLKDWWLRNRNGKWELKISRPSQERNWLKRKVDQYDEIENDQEILQRLNIDGEILNEEILTKYGYGVCCDITTERDCYKQGEFTIVFDEMDFGLKIGECELMVDDHEQGDVAQKMIEKFLANYDMTADAHGAGKVVAYLEKFKPHHYRALVNAGLL